MKKKIILFIPLLLLCAVLVQAPPSTLPHAFYGTTTFNSAATPINSVITATCDSSSSTITVTTAGQYGGAGGDQEKLIVQGCSNGDTITFSISVTGYTGTSTVTDTYEAGAVEEKTLAFTGTAISGGNGGNGGNGGAPAEEEEEEAVTETQTVIAITAGEAAEFIFEEEDEIMIQSIEIVTSAGASNVGVTITESEKPAEAPEPTGSVYKYLEIDKSNLEDADITQVKIKFKVSKSWIESNNIDSDTVKLTKYVDGAWTEITTSMLSSDDGYYYYEATSDSLSIYAITGQAKAVTTTTIPTTTTTIPEKLKKLWYNTFLIGIIIVVILILVYKFVLKR